MITTIIPSRTDAYLETVLASLRESSGNCPVIVGDNGISPSVRAEHPETLFVRVPRPFNFSKAVNMCVARANPESDLLILNDDTVIVSKDLISSLESVLGDPRWQRFAVFSPKISGGVGNRDQAMLLPKDEVLLTRNPICFIAAVVRRYVWDSLEGLDEHFEWYGYDDTDFCRRTVDRGWFLGLIGDLEVKHVGARNGREANGTYSKVFSETKLSEFSNRARLAFINKWGGGPQLGAYAHAPTSDISDRLPSASVLGVAKYTDIEGNALDLWEAARDAAPTVAVELGTRQAVSTRIIRDAIGPEAKFFAIDPDPGCRKFLDGIDCDFMQITGEQFFESVGPDFQMNFCFLDVDPHTYEQTQMFLDLMEPYVAPNGVIVMHDIIENRPEIQVRKAAIDWVATRPTWQWTELEPAQATYRWPQGGLGILRRGND